MEKDLKKQLKIYSDIFRAAQEKGKKEADIVMYIVQFCKDVLDYDIFEEISKEFQIKEKYCDIAIKINGRPELLFEVKQTGIRLTERHIDQAEGYALKSGTKWVILTNGVEWLLFHLSFDSEGGIERSLVFKIDLLKDFEEDPNEVAEKFKLLHKKYYIKGDLDEYWEKKTMLVPQSITAALFSEDVLKVLVREINRGAKVRVNVDDTIKALKNLFDKEVLAELAEIKIKKRKRSRKTKEEKIAEKEEKTKEIPPAEQSIKEGK